MRKRNKEIQLTSYEDLLGMDTVADQVAGQLLYVPLQGMVLLHITEIISHLPLHH